MMDTTATNAPRAAHHGVLGPCVARASTRLFGGPRIWAFRPDAGMVAARAMAKLLNELRAMARELFADKDVYVHSWYEPAHAASPADVKKAEAGLGAALPVEL